jgi:hypothetical protein
MVRAFSSCPTREDGRSGRRSSPHMAHPLAPSGTGSAQRGQRSRSSKTVVLRRNSRTASPFGSEPPIIAQRSRLIHAYKTPFDATRRDAKVRSVRRDRRGRLSPSVLEERIAVLAAAVRKLGDRDHALVVVSLDLVENTFTRSPARRQKVSAM